MPQRKDPLDVDLIDAELSAEVHLLAMLIVAANAADTSLGKVEIDRLLFPN